MAGNAEHLDQEFVETPSSLRRHTSRMEERKVTGIDPKRSRNAHLGWLTVCYREVLEEIAKPSNGSAVEELRLRIHEQWLPYPTFSIWEPEKFQKRNTRSWNKNISSIKISCTHNNEYWKLTLNKKKELNRPEAIR